MVELSVQEVKFDEPFTVDIFENIYFKVKKQTRYDMECYVLLVSPSDIDIKAEWDLIPMDDDKLTESVKECIKEKIDEQGIEKIKRLIKETFKDAKLLKRLGSQETKLKFKTTFGFNMPINGFLKATGLPYFDVIKFDELIHTPDGISTKEHVLNEYGKEALEFVESLMG